MDKKRYNNFTKKFNNDLRRESVVAEYLDKYFYDDSRERITDIETQLKGVDVIYKEMHIDEKAAIDYMDRNLKTFCFELQFTNRYGKIKKGWLLNENLLTDTYLLLYPKGNKELNDINDIHKMEYILVEKEDVKKIIFREDVLNELRDYKSKGEDRREFQIFHEDKPYTLKVVYSKHLIEKPINILLPKELLKKISLKHGFLGN